MPFTTGGLLCPQDAMRILEQVLEAQNSSRYIGLLLKVPDYVVDSIHKEHLDSKDRLYRVIKEFLNGTDPKPTWEAIANALRNPIVNLSRLAKKIEDKFCPPTSVQSGYLYLHSAYFT